MSKFGTLARRQQAKCLQTSSHFSADARSRNDDKALRHGHLLALGCERENLYPTIRGDDAAIKFFADRGIKWHRTARSGDAKGVVGPTRNLASSQVACVNCHLPLAENADAMIALLRAIDPAVRKVVPIAQAGRTSLVEFEWVGIDPQTGKDRTLEGKGGRGANATSVDALLLGETHEGTRRAFLCEWKYTEEYKAGDFKGDGSKGATRRVRYQKLFDAPDSPFVGCIGMDAFLYEPFYQLMRLTLLADRMAHDKELGISEAFVIVVCPEGNTAYRERITSPELSRQFPKLGTVHEVFAASLKHPERFVVTTPEALAAEVAKLPGRDIADWYAYHRNRYGWGT